jgi:hypothetical protein
MYAYTRDPIDSWPGWLTEDQYRRGRERECHDSDDAARIFQKYESFRDAAFNLARGRH